MDWVILQTAGRDFSVYRVTHYQKPLNVKRDRKGKGPFRGPSSYY